MNEYKIQIGQEQYVNCKEGTKFIDLVGKYYNGKVLDIAICKLNNKYYELGENVPCCGKLTMIPFTSVDGMKVYARTLQYVFIKATLDLFKDAKIVIQHSIDKGIFGEIHKITPLDEEDINKIKNRMKEIVNKNIPINKVKVKREKAIDIFKSYGMDDKVLLLEQVNFESVSLYELDGRYDYFYGYMAQSTGVIKAFDVMYYDPGFILRYPLEEDINTLVKFKEQKKLASIFMETERWLNILGVGEVGSLNEKIINGDLASLIMTSEALHEKKIAEIADKIFNRRDTRIVLIAGPSSSGKTTFANRLAIQLRVNGLIPIPISLDDYFVNREDTPIDEDGEYDFETIQSVDIKLFNEQLREILKGNEVELPTFNFLTGKREWIGNKIKLPQNGVVIIEGIHGLNPILTSEIDDKYKFKIYISALTQLNLDNHNRISTTDVRRIRRIVRDHLSRGHEAEDTLKMWPKIKRGEQKNIFVYQEEADVMFNSTLVYELCVLKKAALEELNKIDEDNTIYNEAKRLKSFLGFFKEIDYDLVPQNSILREFIGGSIFYKY
ncbi:nucleoside kinase [Clostridium sp. NSJ-49]|uniref:Uridine kinase n=1 Tax=Clostridium disporicum TaxID=84024 RepID=A0A174CH58_9CLOT|nr:MULTISPECIES: nucleoside kinase [Clostridium]MBC5626354.1 nucleoside kinase [Clostridium sp. NSJ-49]CUO12247.1 uridine kinase [Clostridium disporicum]